MIATLNFDELRIEYRDGQMIVTYVLRGEPLFWRAIDVVPGQACVLSGFVATTDAITE